MEKVVNTLDNFVEELIRVACLPPHRRNGQDNIAVYAKTEELPRADGADTFYSNTRVWFKGEMRGENGRISDVYIHEGTDSHERSDGPFDASAQSRNYINSINSMIHDRVSFLETNVDGVAMAVQHAVGYFSAEDVE